MKEFSLKIGIRLMDFRDWFCSRIANYCIRHACCDATVFYSITEKMSVGYLRSQTEMIIKDKERKNKNVD